MTKKNVGMLVLATVIVTGGLPVAIDVTEHFEWGGYPALQSANTWKFVDDPFFYTVQQTTYVDHVGNLLEGDSRWLIVVNDVPDEWTDFTRQYSWSGDYKPGVTDVRVFGKDGEIEGGAPRWSNVMLVAMRGIEKYPATRFEREPGYSPCLFN